MVSSIRRTRKHHSLDDEALATERLLKPEPETVNLKPPTLSGVCMCVRFFVYGLFSNCRTARITYQDEPAVGLGFRGNS